MSADHGFETLSIHAGQEPDPQTGAVMTPIYQTSTYAQEAVGLNRGYEYSRTDNPTRTALQRCLAALELGKHGLAFASGMAAIDAILRLAEPGDTILAVDDLYGGTYRLFSGVYAKFGINFRYFPGDDLGTLVGLLGPTVRMVWLETPTNPWLRLVDIEAVVEAVRQHSPDSLVVVDNTFASPYLQKPLQLGADIVVHSTTKYLGGHSDLVGGALVCKRDVLHEQLAFLQNAAGAIPGPMDCFLTLRGIKTLPVRMDRHAQNAQALAEYLHNHPAVKRVLYPTHLSHPQRSLAIKQMRNGGGMMSFLHAGGAEKARIVAESTRLFTLAESLGGVESLIEIPARMTHLAAEGSGLEVDLALIRLSVGLETIEDLMDDLDQALERST